MTVDTPAGELSVGKRHRLRVRYSDGQEREIVGTLAALEPTPIGHCPTCACVDPVGTRFELRGDETIGFLPENVLEVL